MFASIDLDIVSQEVRNFLILTARETDNSVTSGFLALFQLPNRTFYCDIHHAKTLKQRLEHLRPLFVGNGVNDNFITAANQSGYRAIKTFVKFGSGKGTEFFIA